MNRLLGSVAYLAGPIDRCPEGGARWRDWITPELNRRAIATLDPLKKPFSVGLEDDDGRRVRQEWKQDPHWGKIREVMKVVRAVDLRMVDFSHFLVALLDMDIPMCGTYEEIFWANRMKRPVLVWCPQGKHRIPDWLFGTLRHEEMFGDVHELLAYLDGVAEGSVEPEPGRWLFPDWHRIYTPDVLAAITRDTRVGKIRTCV